MGKDNMLTFLAITIGTTSIISGALGIWSRTPITQNTLKDLKKEDKAAVEVLIKKGVPNEEIRAIIVSLKTINDDQIKDIGIILESTSPQEMQKLANKFEDLQEMLNKAKNGIEEGNYSKANNAMITARGLLSDLRGVKGFNAGLVDSTLQEYAKEWHDSLVGKQKTYMK
jgi:hypothetical protein